MTFTAHTNGAGLFEGASASSWRRVLVAAIGWGAWRPALEPKCLSDLPNKQQPE